MMLPAHRFRERQTETRGAPFPPPNLRVSDSGEGDEPEKECGTCKMYFNGVCGGYFNLPVYGEWVCDSWLLDPNWQQQDAEQDQEDGLTDEP